MKRLFPIVLWLGLALVFAGSIQAANEKCDADEILTAIDVADLMMRGSSDADIAALLSCQMGFDRASAMNKGKTDERIINDLVAKPRDDDGKPDDSKSLQLRAEGDKYFNVGQYDRAAKEYFLALRYSKYNFMLYKLRADTYKQYLMTKLSISAGAGPEGTIPTGLGRSRKLLCNSMHSDYAKANRLNNERMVKIVSDLNQLQYKMSDPQKGYDPGVNADPYHNSAAAATLNARQLRGLYQLQRMAGQARNNIEEAMSHYGSVCREEDAALREYFRMERDKKRDKKWVKYGETEEARYFYDSANITKGTDNLNVWTRRENTDEDESYYVSRVRIYCRESMIGTIELMDYDEMGNLVKTRQFSDNVIMMKVNSGAIEEMLLKETCK